MGTVSRPPGKAMYVAPRPDWDWLRIEQRKLYTQSEEQVDLLGLVAVMIGLSHVLGERHRARATGEPFGGRRVNV